MDVSPAVRNRMESVIKSYLRMGFAVNLLSSDIELTSPAYRQFSTIGEFSHTPVIRFGRLHTNFFLRAIFEILSACKAYFLANKSLCEITIITIPSMFFVIPLALLSKKTLVVADIRDLTWEYLSTKSLSGRFAKRVISWFVDRGLRSAHAYTVTNEAEAAYVRALSPKTPCFHLANGISTNSFNDLVRLPIKLPEAETQVAYVGNIGIAQNLITLVSAAALKPNVKFKIVGDGVEFASLKKHCEDKKLCNVSFCGVISWQEILKIYAESDILYGNISENYFTAVPSKIFEYCSTGRKVIFGCKGISREILSKFQGVKIIDPDNVEELIYAIDCCDDALIEKFADENRFIIENTFLREQASDSVAMELVKALRRKFQ